MINPSPKPNPFTPAVKKQHALRLALVGPSGAGKTFTALRLAQGLGQKIACIDTEHGSAALYAPQFTFDHLVLESFAPQDYIEAVQAAATYGYEVLIIDSLSHAWMGKGGILEMKEAVASRDYSGNDRHAWRTVTPEHNRLVEAMLRSPLHIIATMRSRVEYVVEPDEHGKTVIRKIGLKPMQQDGLDFEFDIVGDLDQAHTLTITKTHCSALSRAVIPEPGADLAETLKAWLGTGADPTVTEDQIKTLWELGKAQGLSVGDLVAFINHTLQTAYRTPREMTQAQFPQIVTALQARQPSSAASA
ncbi:MAG: AAA family ATPase [Sulfobacillus benefaciens]|uniref:AAA family ATPase n=1 Tax=Sulfobacillus benefaciens TaxID=453960 RepID=A0A2T2XCV9_9FIRM|nr:MAG: AAA family ATPase [Sulfobacillus benefaciens]